MIDTDSLVEKISKELNIPRHEIVYKGIKSFLESQLDLIKTKLSRLHVKYKVNSVEEFEKQYENGSVEEAQSLEDFQEMDRLEYRKEKIEQMLDEI
jgi:hypothetical protein